MPRFMEAAGCFPKEEGWDHGIWPTRSDSERLLRLVGCVKGAPPGSHGPPDVRVLVPLTIHQPFSAYVAQCISEGDSLWEGPPDQRERRVRRAFDGGDTPVVRTWEAKPTYLADLPMGRAKAVCLKSLDDQGLTENFEFLKAQGNQFYFQTTGHRGCLTCGNGHDSNNFIINFQCTGELEYFCLSDRWIPHINLVSN